MGKVMGTVGAPMGPTTRSDVHSPAAVARSSSRPAHVDEAPQRASFTAMPKTKIDAAGTATATAVVNAEALRARGAGIAIVTRGVHGAALATADGTWLLGNLPAAHRGPFSVGSGDAFLAGFLAGLARGLAPDDALRLAGAAGAANARTPGQGELDPAEVERTERVLEVVRG